MPYEEDFSLRSAVRKRESVINTDLIGKYGVGLRRHGRITAHKRPALYCGKSSIERLWKKYP
jgi:hypothetical protein